MTRRIQMSSRTAEARTARLPITSASAEVHPGWVRITHWINVVAMFVMITSGWRICDASPVFGFMIAPTITIGDGLGCLAGALLWHFGAMWLLVINGIVYLTWGIVSGWFGRKLLPIRPSELVDDLRAALTGRLNAVQRLLYAGVIAFGIVSVLSGVVTWKPVQVQGLTAAFGGYEGARFVHFFAMAAIVCFLAVHITLAILVPRSLRAMIIGR